VVDGLAIRYEIHGSGTPLLLIMGLGGHLDIWRSFQSSLQDFETIAFNAPGAGSSPSPLLPLRMRQLARLTAHLLDALGYEKVDVLGVSLGGGVAQELTRQMPDRVRRLVLVATACGVGAVPGNPLVLLGMATPYRYYSRGFFERYAASTYGGRLRTEPDLVREVAGQWLSHPPSVWGYISQVSALWGWTSLPWLHRISQPTLVLTGDDDPLVPPINSKILANRIPSARLEVLPGGHLLLLEQTDRIAGLVRDFLCN
jgi:poly(3-hydroxyalkanoate) depolymerase